MRELRIFDVSTFIHAGKVNKHSFLRPSLVETADGFEERRIYTGGVSMLWNILYEVYGTCDLAFCMDTRPTMKQEMFPDYKATRAHNPEIHKQKEACEYILRDCGLEILKEEGYEADDFIYSLVRDKKKEYDHIYIYTGDSDMYFLVDDTVTIMPSSSRAKMVTRQNYTYTVGQYVPYNTLTFNKILWGDKSDNIPPLPSDVAEKLQSVFVNDFYSSMLGDKQTVLDLLQMFGKEVVDQATLVFPLDVRTPDTFGAGDKLKIAEWGNAIKNRLWRNNAPLSEHITQCIEEMSEIGLYTD